MRLWTLHPKYLDTQGLLAVWREALLAQRVLEGRTKGYTKHPQLLRFTSSAKPTSAIAQYLRVIYEESVTRNYKFNHEKIGQVDYESTIVCTRGQLLYEWRHLKEKLRKRDARKFSELEKLEVPDQHPLFKIADGDIEVWEIRQARRYE